MENNRKYGGEKMVVRKFKLGFNAIVSLALVYLITLITYNVTNLEVEQIMAITFIIILPLNIAILGSLKFKTKKRPALNRK